jgi:hypothetical protein
MSRRGLIIEGLAAAARFVAPAWRQTWGAMALAGGLFGAIWAMRLASAASAWRPLALLLMGLAAVVFQGALYRVALNRSRPGLAGLWFGRAEARIAGVWALSLLFLFVLALLALVVMLAFGFAVAASGPGFVTALPGTWAGAVQGRGRIVLAIVGIACLAGLVWAGIRVSFGAAASVERGQLQVLASWPMTRGLVGVILLGQLALGIPPACVAVALLRVAAGAADPPPALAWSAGLAAGGLLAGLWLPSGVGFMTYLYRRSSGPPAGDMRP